MREYYRRQITKMGKTQKKVFYTSAIILGLLVLLSIGGLTYAWFSAIVTGNEEAKGAVVETGTLSIVYTNGQELRGENILPGWSETKTFTVENTGTVEASYNINWENITNTFVNKSDLVYKLTSTNGGGTLNETQVPESGEHVNVIGNIKIAPETIQEYSLTITYKNRDADQSSDMGKSIIGKIEVLDVNESTGKIATEVIEEKATEGNSEGLIKISQSATSQTKETTEYRYSGSNVKNYVRFNDEEWRIIGIFDVDNGSGTYEKRMKLVKSEGIGSYSWDSTDNSINEGYGINQWGESGSYPGADLMQLLNGVYYNSGSGTCYTGCSNQSSACDFSNTGLNKEAQNMVGNAKWYTAGFDTLLTLEPFTSKYSYTNERGTLVTDTTMDTGINLTRTNSSVGKVGLIYPSDWGYSSGSCYNNEEMVFDYYAECIESSWLKDYVGYTITQSTMAGSTIHFITDEAYIDSSVGVCNAESIRPAVYLNANVKITSGDGTKSNPYELGI